MVTVVAPFLNEINFAKAWAENVSKYADQVVLCDTGSTDGSDVLLASYGFEIFNYKVKSPYDWEEGKIRNLLLEKSRGDWIVTQDLDELVDDRFVKLVNNMTTKKHFIRFPVYWFCYSLKTRKIRSGLKRLREGREHRSIRVVKNSPYVKYVGENHCYFAYRELPKGSARLSMLDSEIPIYHYHTMFPQKKGDNSHRSYWIDGEKLVSYLGEHPKEIKHLEIRTV